MIDKKLSKIIEEYQKLPNAPFFQKYTSSYIRSLLNKAGITYKETQHYILVRPHKTVGNKKKLVIMAHTDHPAIVFKNSVEGKLLGLIGTSSLLEYARDNVIKLKVFSPENKFLGKVRLAKLIPGPKQELTVVSPFHIPKNSIGMFDVITYREDSNNTLDLYNADDGIMVSILLYMLQERKFGDTYDLYVVFNKHEEVHQLSSWELAQTNVLELTPEDFILNLECLKTESIDEDLYGKIDYKGGPVLQLSNTGCLFGYKNKGKNKLEIVLRELATVNKFKLQPGIIKDSCDARPFSQFGLSSNICGLTIPNKYKHNGADDGFIRSECIEVEDIVVTVSLLSKLTSNLIVSDLRSISEKLKLKNMITDVVLLRNKALLNRRLEIAYQGVLKRGYFYPVSLFDHIADFVVKLASYIVYTFLRGFR